MKRFEYRREPIQDDYSSHFLNKLNELGQEGWEVVSIFMDNDRDYRLVRSVFFKRELPAREGGHGDSNVTMS